MTAIAKDFKAEVDPAIEVWASDFDRWLDTPEGRAYLKSKGEEAEERAAQSDWQGPNW